MNKSFIMPTNLGWPQGLNMYFLSSVFYYDEDFLHHVMCIRFADNFISFRPLFKCYWISVLTNWFEIHDNILTVNMLDEHVNIVVNKLNNYLCKLTSQMLWLCLYNRNKYASISYNIHVDLEWLVPVYICNWNEMCKLVLVLTNLEK